MQRSWQLSAWLHELTRRNVEGTSYVFVNVSSCLKEGKHVMENMNGEKGVWIFFFSLFFSSMYQIEVRTSSDFQQNI